MTTPASKAQHDQNKPSSVSGRSKPKGKRMSLREYKLAQKAELDKILKAYGA
ncbi:hypothetical protein [Pseudomonas aeruginosa]